MQFGLQRGTLFLVNPVKSCRFPESCASHGLWELQNGYLQSLRSGIAGDFQLSIAHFSTGETHGNLRLPPFSWSKKKPSPAGLSS